MIWQPKESLLHWLEEDEAQAEDGEEGQSQNSRSKVLGRHHNVSVSQLEERWSSLPPDLEL